MKPIHCLPPRLAALLFSAMFAGSVMAEPVPDLDNAQCGVACPLPGPNNPAVQAMPTVRPLTDSGVMGVGGITHSLRALGATVYKTATELQSNMTR